MLAVLDARIKQAESALADARALLDECRSVLVRHVEADSGGYRPVDGLLDRLQAALRDGEGA